MRATRTGPNKTGPNKTFNFFKNDYIYENHCKNILLLITSALKKIDFLY